MHRARAEHRNFTGDCHWKGQKQGCKRDEEYRQSWEGRHERVWSSGMTIEEPGERLVEGLGLLQVRQMRGRGDDDELGARQILVDLARHRYRLSGILFADDDERGNLHF